MAGGIFNTFNKVLPGAYFRFTSVSKPKGLVGDRGVATMPLELSWGEKGKVIELYSTDLTDGKSLEKVGFTYLDDNAKLARLCLENAYKLLAYRLDTGGAKAKATIGTLTATAKYEGEFGNLIQVSILEKEAAKEVITFVREKEVDRQTATKISDLKPNKFVDFSGEGEITANAGIALTGGKNGKVSEDAYTNYLNTMKTEGWQVMGVVTSDLKVKALVTKYIKDLRDISGRYVQGVLSDYVTANTIGIISPKQGFEREGEVVSETEIVSYITGISAAARVNETNCYKLINGATRIIGELTDDEITADIKKGYYMLGKRVDGKIVVVDDTNTFTDFNDELTEDYADNFVVRLFDEIATTTRLQFEVSRIGKTANVELGRDTFKAQLIANFEALEKLQPYGAIENFVSDDIIIEKGDGDGDVIVGGYIQPAGHMKKLYGTFYKGKKEAV